MTQPFEAFLMDMYQDDDTIESFDSWFESLDKVDLIVYADKFAEHIQLLTTTKCHKN